MGYWDKLSALSPSQSSHTILSVQLFSGKNTPKTPIFTLAEPIDNQQNN